MNSELDIVFNIFNEKEITSVMDRYLNQSQHLIMISLKDKSEYVDIAAVWNKENANPALQRLIQIIKNIKMEDT